METRPPKFRITNYRNGSLPTRSFPFHFEHLDHPSLEELRQHYHLDDVVSHAKTEFDRIIALRQWVRGQWDFGLSYRQHEPFIRALNALEILKAAESGVRFHCAYEATVLIQCALSLGILARRLVIRKNFHHQESNNGHRTSEVWSNELQKWVVMDATFNCHYVHEGKPMSAYDIHQAWMEGRCGEITVMDGDPPPAQLSRPWKYSAEDLAQFSTSYPTRLMPRYYQIALEMQNNWLSSDGECPWLVWTEPPCPPILVVSTGAAVRNVIWTDNINELYWPMNQVHIHLACIGPAPQKPTSILRVKLETDTPSFREYMVRFDGEPWRAEKEIFEWPLKAGQNTITAKAINCLGVEGPTSSIQVEYGT